MLKLASHNPYSGCPKCWSASAENAWSLVKEVPIRKNLVDESHFIVNLRVCPACAQHFLQVTTEEVDWVDGEDPVYRTVMPIDAGERDRLEACTDLTTADLARIGPDRRSLRYDWPKGSEPKVYWDTGIRHR